MKFDKISISMLKSFICELAELEVTNFGVACINNEPARICDSRRMQKAKKRVTRF
jgi:hypothetical protein